MNLRWYLFWVQDFIINRGMTWSAYKDIKKTFYSEEKFQAEKIKALLEHANETTEFYKGKGLELSNFPVMTKRDFLDNYDKILSSKYKGKRLHSMSTSGSTGTPFRVVQDRRKRCRVIASILFFGQLCNFTFGERQMFFRVWVRIVKKSWFKKFLQNMITEDISRLDDEELKQIENTLINDKKIRNMLGYSSTLDMVSKYLLNKGYGPKDFSVTSIIAGSETLQDKTRENLRKLFGCTVISRYSNEENGILGQNCLESDNDFHLNYANYHFEFLKLDEDKPAEEGEVARIVITDLYNYAFPMIRYDTGDLAIVGQASCSHKEKVLKEVMGRRVDLIRDAKGEPLSPYIIVNNMWNMDKVKQFKFVQLSDIKYKFVLNVEQGFDSEKILLERFKKLLGEEAIITFEYTDEIPVMNSGKRKYVENLCDKKS